MYVPGTQSRTEDCETVLRSTAEVKVQSKGARFFRKIGNGINSKETVYPYVDTEFLGHFLAKSCLYNIVRQWSVAWSGRVSWSRFERPTRKTPCSFRPITVINQEYLRRGRIFVDHDGYCPHDPASGKQPFKKSCHPWRKQPPNIEGKTMKVGVVLNEPC